MERVCPGPLMDWTVKGAIHCLLCANQLFNQSSRGDGSGVPVRKGYNGSLHGGGQLVLLQGLCNIR